MNEVLKVVKERRSVRSFQGKDIPEEVVRKLIDAMVWAPSAGNLQSRKFYAIRDGRGKRGIAVAALNQDFIAHAPLVIVGCADRRIEARYGERGVNLYALQDVACSLMNMMLVAWENGLGSVWVGAFRENEIIQSLGLPPHLRPVAIVPVGYPSRIPSAPPRVSAEDAVVFRS
ncbi:MAG TPA: nitroreductase family protein [Thermodesulfovibrionales bacterium]|jgi:nitroreductase|nr:nitroreductase family protein [Thermodesulfovibrionales bacterium]